MADNAPEHNAQMRRRLAQTRKHLKEGLEWQLVFLRGKTLKNLTPQAREELYHSYEEEYHSEFTDPDMKKLLRQLMHRVCPEKLLQVQSETVDEEDEQAFQSPDQQETWQQVSHDRPPPHHAPGPYVPAVPFPFIAHVLCLHCEKYFYGQLLIRTTCCPLCGQARLRKVGEWDLRTDPWYPFHKKGGAA